VFAFWHLLFCSPHFLGVGISLSFRSSTQIPTATHTQHALV